MAEGEKKRRGGDPHAAARAPKSVSADQWEAFVRAFRDHPAQSAKVAKLVGCGENRARRMWLKGVPKLGLPPIKYVLGQEQIAARARREEAELEAELEAARLRERQVVGEMATREEQRQRAADDAARTRREEGLLVTQARRNALALQVALAPVLMKASKLGDAMGLELEKLAAGKGPVDLKGGMNLLRQAATIARFGNEASKLAVSMERLLMGQPDREDLGEGAPKLEPGEAIRLLEATLQAVKRSEARRTAIVVAAEVVEDG